MMVLAFFLVNWLIAVLLLRRFQMRLTLNWFYFIVIVSTICYVIGGTRR
jgi:hypothetical protein